MSDDRPPSPTFGAPRPRVMPKPAPDEAQDPIYMTRPPAQSPAQPQAAQPARAEILPVSTEDPGRSVPAAPVAEPASAPHPVQADEPAVTVAFQAVPEPVEVLAPAAVEAATATPAPAAPSPVNEPAPAAPVSKVRRQEVFVQIGSRVTVETRDMLDDIIAREGISMRNTLEKIIREYHAK